MLRIFIAFLATSILKLYIRFYYSLNEFGILPPEERSGNSISSTTNQTNNHSKYRIM